MGKTLKEQLQEVLVPAQMDSHESDLYVEKTPASTAIIAAYPYQACVSTFRDQITGRIWYDIFAANYDTKAADEC